VPLELNVPVLLKKVKGICSEKADSLLSPDAARVVLASVRLFNGAFALLAPVRFLRGLDMPPGSEKAAVYVSRLFGVRTAILGISLLVKHDSDLTEELREAVLIHATDTVSAGLAGIQGFLPARSSALITLLSATNTTLAVTALRGQS
jgi:hypothetical protein